MRGSRVVTQLLVVLVALGLHCETNNQKAFAMANIQDQAVRLLELADAEYSRFDETQQIRLQDALGALVDEQVDQEGADIGLLVLALGGPKRLQWDTKSSIPVLIGSVQSGLRRWQVNYATNLHLFARNLDSGDLWVAQPLLNMRRGEVQLLSGRGTPPDEVNATSIDYGVETVDLREKFEQTFYAGRWVITAVVYEMLSNSVEMVIETDAEKPVILPVAQQSYIRYALRDIAELPNRVELLSDKEGHHHLRVMVQVDGGAQVNQDSSPAMLRCNLILIKLDERPLIIPVTTPVIATNQQGQLFNAIFQVDLNAAVGATLGGKYQIYLDLGKTLRGPFAVEL